MSAFPVKINQHPPEKVPRIFKILKKNYGTSIYYNHHSNYNNINSHVVWILTKIDPRRPVHCLMHGWPACQDCIDYLDSENRITSWEEYGNIKNDKSRTREETKDS